MMRETLGVFSRSTTSTDDDLVDAIGTITRHAMSGMFRPHNDSSSPSFPVRQSPLGPPAPPEARQALRAIDRRRRAVLPRAPWRVSWAASTSSRRSIAARIRRSVKL